jgi:hypothetical protein
MSASIFEMTNWTISCNLFSFNEFVADGMTLVAAWAPFGRQVGRDAIHPGEPHPSPVGTV